MRTVIKILGIEEKWDKTGKKYHRTHALLDTGDEVVGYGNDFNVGDLVEHFYEERWDTHKMRKPIDK